MTAFTATRLTGPRPGPIPDGPLLVRETQLHGLVTVPLYVRN